MVHNGIEYGIMAAYAEGLSVLKSANVGSERSQVDAETTPLRDPEDYQFNLNLADIPSSSPSRVPRVRPSSIMES